jgi:Putative peptidoglycan binding domain
MKSSLDVRSYLILLSLALILILVPRQASAYAGSGTASDPYLITTCQELQNIPQNSTDIFWLAHDIDCSASSGWDGGAGFNPIASFNGTFDGRNHTISNIYINRPTTDYVGLFTNSSNASFFNLNITGTMNTGNLSGSLVGSSYNPYIENIHSSVNMNSATSSNIGGLIGISYYANTVMKKSSYTGTIQADNYVGGLIGTAQYGANIYDSFASTTITASSYAGGLVGLVQNNCGLFQTYRSYATGSITSGNYAGGLVGYFSNSSCYSDTISDSFSNVVISGPNPAGIVGSIYNSNVSIIDSYFDSANASTTNCAANTGGSSFSSSGCNSFSSISTPNYLINNSTDEPFTTGQWDFVNVWQTSTSSLPVLQAPSLSGYHAPGPVRNVVISQSNLNTTVSWDGPADSGNFAPDLYYIQVKRASSTDWIDSIDSNQMGYASSATSTFSYYDFRYDKTYDFRIRSHNQYGYSDWVEVSHDTGNAPVHNISSCADLQAMDDNISTIGDTYVLTQDVSCDGVVFAPIGSDNAGWSNAEFEGVFDGQGHTISNLTINLPTQSNIGLFYALRGATVKNLNLNGGTITGVEDVGSIAGYAEDGITVTNVHSNLSIVGPFNPDWNWGGQYMGGLIGYQDAYGYQNMDVTISSSTFSGTLTGTYALGGLVGYMDFYPDLQATSTTGYYVQNNTVSGSIIGDEVNGSTRIGGLFGEVDVYNTEYDSQTISGLFTNNTVTSATSMSGGQYMGGLFGYLDFEVGDNYTTTNFNINDNSVNTSINSTSSMLGGLVGYLYTYFDSANEILNLGMNSNTTLGSITSSGDGNIGGLIGKSETHTGNNNSVFTYDVSRNKSLMSLSGNDDGVGGLFGFYYSYSDGVASTSQSFYQNFASSTVMGTTNNVGGLAGQFYIDGVGINMSDSYFTGLVQGNQDIGGLVGNTSGYDGAHVDLSRVYSVGNIISANGIEGGLVGRNQDGLLNISDSFSAQSLNSGDFGDIGTILGNNTANYTFQDVLFDNGLAMATDLCVGNESNPIAGCTAVNTMESQNPTYFINTTLVPPFAGDGSIWDFDTVWATSTTSYPTLRQNVFVPTPSTPSSPGGLPSVQIIYGFTGTGSTGGTSTGGGSSGGSSMSASVANAVSNISTSTASTTITTSVATSTPIGTSTPALTLTSFKFTRTLQKGMVGNDVLQLQKLLNSHGYPVATSGPGSVGNETTKFGSATQSALIKFQKANNIKPAVGMFGPVTRGVMSR